ncbi:arsenate reductase [Salinisphaera dokdonensis CL-ES53]|uniref:Arsenate reductase n=1 Tax=Salinisphaera dokdonensis CL-ES53 TaxID=1304272 RepID=A0ABV2B132_9GAMM
MPPVHPYAAAMRLYYNPRCSKSRAARQLLEEAGHAVEIVNYLDTPPDAITLARLLEHLDAEPADLVRTTDAAFRDRAHPATTLNREAVIDLLQATPELMQRPVLDTGTRAIIARPPERVFELVDNSHNH